MNDLRSFFVGRSDLLGAIRRRLTLRGTVKLIEQSKLFDPDWYLAAYPDVKRGKLKPIDHFVLHGGAELRSPSLHFDPRWYVSAYPDVVPARFNPLVHYITSGKIEGRAAKAAETLNARLTASDAELLDSGGNDTIDDIDNGLDVTDRLEENAFQDDAERVAVDRPVADDGDVESDPLSWEESFEEDALDYTFHRPDVEEILKSNLFDWQWYGDFYIREDCSELEAVQHYLDHGAEQGHWPNPYFDNLWYLRQYEDVRHAGMEPFHHYIRHPEGRKPNPYFDTDWYRSHNPDSAGMSALRHFIEIGEQQFRAPSSTFDPYFYREIAGRETIGTRPLKHFLHDGRLRGLPGTAVLDVVDGDDPIDANIVHLKTAKIADRREWVLFLTHSPWGGLKPHVLAHLDAFKRQGVGVVLIAATDRPFVVSAVAESVCDIIIARDNVGLDFSAWAHVLRLHPELYDSDVVYLANDSVFGPSTQDAFDVVIKRVRSSEMDIIGLTESYDHGWHVQSYFLALKSTALSSIYLQRFFQDVRTWSDKDTIIQSYEVKLAPGALVHGLKVDVLFQNFDPDNPTLYAWKKLLDAGFPFVKVLLLKGNFPGTDMTDWRIEVSDRGFDLKIIDLVLNAKHDLSSAKVAAGQLAVVRQDLQPPSSRNATKVAFYGPWNYDSGLGFASRGIVSAIRRAGFKINLHPIKTNFHIHHPLSPPIDICDFEGDPDVAIVHLNPDSWHLLTPDQRTSINRAHRRIGYWVWEMAHLPSAWITNFTAVDRVWAPSNYCAEVFRANGAAAVDLVPHVVTVKPASDKTSERKKILERFNVSVDAKVILFTFDGSSYLIRKNPAALVRAFRASQLGSSGWILVLKTKHLMDRPKEGAALTSLAEKTASVVLLDATLTSEELDKLMDAADIYASPHSSEGFGLTIAEAMARGKIVVATDFGGSRDFLDLSSGFPVRAKETRLKKDFGHYTTGGVWGVVDEPDLTRALLKAAERVEAGDTAVGEAARARIARQLSIEAVSQQIAKSVDDVLAGPRRSFLTERLHPPSTPGGVAVLEADFGPQFNVVALQDDCSPECEFDFTAASETANWVVFAPEDARLSYELGAKVLAAAAKRADVAIFYTDHVAFGEATLSRQLALKPSFDATLLASSDYMGPALIVRMDVLHRLGGPLSAFASAAMFHLVLRALDAGFQVDRIAEVLVAYPGLHPEIDVNARRIAISSTAAFKLYETHLGPTPASIALGRRFANHPDVSLLVPTRRTAIPDGEAGPGVATFIERLLEALVEVDWPPEKLHVIVGDDIEDNPPWAQMSWPFKLRRIPTPRSEGAAFNYAAKMNTLWRAAPSEMLVMLNDDVHPKSSGWLKALMSFAVDGGVGGVGARLLYENGSVQHAGIVGGLFGAAAHAWLGEEAYMPTYQEWAVVQREWSMVTGAVFATRKSLMEEVSGFEERFSLEFNDIDLCLRLRALGYRIVYNPEAELTHRERASRGDSPLPGSDVALFQSRWRRWLADDPSYNPGMRKDVFALRPSWVHRAWFT